MKLIQNFLLPTFLLILSVNAGKRKQNQSKLSDGSTSGSSSSTKANIPKACRKVENVDSCVNKIAELDEFQKACHAAKKNGKRKEKIKKKKGKERNSVDEFFEREFDDETENQDGDQLRSTSENGSDPDPCQILKEKEKLFIQEMKQVIAHDLVAPTILLTVSSCDQLFQ